MLVVDASALIGWVMADEAGIDLHAALAAHDEVLAPWLLWVELRNILLVSERRGRLPAGMADQIIDTIDDLDIRLDVTPAGPVVLDLASATASAPMTRCILRPRCAMAARWPAWTRRCCARPRQRA